jgi:hypothetical protein
VQEVGHLGRMEVVGKTGAALPLGWAATAHPLFVRRTRWLNQAPNELGVRLGTRRKG